MHIADARPILESPYFQRLRDGSLDRESFVRSQAQFYYAVRYFSRAMAALLARLPDSASRATLMHNLAEEHGWDDEKFDRSMAHDRTFLKFLASLGARPEPQEAPVRAFNLALYGACASEPPALALACLGIIESSFADISALIGRAVVERGWIPSEKLVHYKLHAEIDKRHAAELFAEVQDADPREVDEGMALGLFIFERLYSSLL